MQGSPYVFTGATGTAAYRGMGKQSRRISGFELSYSDGTIASLLGHKGSGVTSRYIHRPDQALASAAQAVSAEVDRMLGGATNLHFRISKRRDGATVKIRDSHLGTCSIRHLRTLFTHATDSRPPFRNTK